MLELLNLSEHFQERLVADVLMRKRNVLTHDLLLGRRVLCDVLVEQNALKFSPDCPAVSDACEVGVHAVSSA